MEGSLPSLWRCPCSLLRGQKEQIHPRRSYVSYPTTSVPNVSSKKNLMCWWFLLVQSGSPAQSKSGRTLGTYSLQKVFFFHAVHIEVANHNTGLLNNTTMLRVQLVDVTKVFYVWSVGHSRLPSCSVGKLD